MKPTPVTFLASFFAVAASHAAATAVQPGNSRDGFGVGWTGTLRRAVCVQAHVEGAEHASLIEVRNYDGTRIGQIVLCDPPFIKELADRAPVPAKYGRVRVKVVGASDAFSRTYFLARIIK